MKLRLGVVGLGAAWESRHAPALRALSDRFEVRAVCEPVAHRAAQVAKQFGARAEDGFRALASREDIDAILLLSADWLGSLPILAASEYGKAVYCAVALELDAEQARVVKQRVEDSGVAFVAELPRRLAPATLRLKQLMAAQLGQPQLLFCHQRSTAHGVGSEARWSNMRNLVEAVDWCRYVVGRDATSVLGLAHEAPNGRPLEDYQMMSLDFSSPGRPGSGPIAQISCGRYIHTNWHEAPSFRPPADLQVACQHGVAFIDLPSTLIWFDSAGRHMESMECERPLGEQLLSQFHRAVTSLIRDTSNLEDAYRAVWIALQAQTSRVEGRRVSLAL